MLNLLITFFSQSFLPRPTQFIGYMTDLYVSLAFNVSSEARIFKDSDLLKNNNFLKHKLINLTTKTTRKKPKSSYIQKIQLNIRLKRHKKAFEIISNSFNRQFQLLFLLSFFLFN